MSSICASSIFVRKLSEVRSSDRNLTLASSDSRRRSLISEYIPIRDGDEGRRRPSVTLWTYPVLVLLGLDLELWKYGPPLSREEKEERRLDVDKFDSFWKGPEEDPWPASFCSWLFLWVTVRLGLICSNSSGLRA